MSLINQMLRDLESRNATNHTSPLQGNVQISKPPESKNPLLIWSLLAIIISSATYWTYQYRQTLMVLPPVIVTDNLSKNPAPITPYEKVLSAPNAITASIPIPEQKSPEISSPSASFSKPEPAIQTVHKIAANSQAQPLTVTRPVSGIVDKFPTQKKFISSTPLLNKQLSAKQQANLLFRQNENNFTDSLAADKLEQIIRLDPRHLKARLLLAKILYSQGQISRTAEFLDQSLSLFPDNLQFINTRAQLFLKQNNSLAALKTLQHVDIANSSNETYLSLLAATYQMQQSFTDAIRVYHRLTIVNPNKAENWLGLALAQDKLNNTKLAREAYQQAFSKNTLKESITNYIKQRLSDLK